MAAYGYSPYYAAPVYPTAAPIVPAPTPYPTVYTMPGSVMAVGQDQTTPPSALANAKTWLQVPSLGGLNRGTWLALAVGAATLGYGATTNWYGLGPKKTRTVRAHRDYGYDY
jgi:hypothetical protein